MGIGGYMGYAKKGSMASLMGGLTIGLSFIVSGYFLLQSTNLSAVRRGHLIGLLTSVLLAGVGAMRYFAVSSEKNRLPPLPVLFIVLGSVMALINGSKYFGKI